MAYLTPTEAKDEAYGLVTSLFTDWLTANDQVCEIRYQGKIYKDEPQGTYVRLSMQQVLSPQRGFLHIEDGSDSAVFETAGLFFCLVHVPMAMEDGFRNGDLIATALRNTMRSTDTGSGMWFRNARFNELPSDGQFYKWNVIAEYEFDERN